MPPYHEVRDRLVLEGDTLLSGPVLKVGKSFCKSFLTTNYSG